MATAKTISPIRPDDKEWLTAAIAELLATMDRKIALMIELDINGKDPSKWGVLACVFTRIVLQHLYQNYPLAFPPEVIAAYLAAGEKLETPLHECEACGYCLPRCFQACPLCGGRVGLGMHSGRRGRQAALN